MSNKDKLSVDDIIDFLKQEREVYGAFSVSENRTPDLETDQPSSKGQNSTDENDLKPLTILEKIDRCKSLEELKNLSSEAEELKTDLAGTNLVFGVGNPNADLMLIGEAPGEQEDKQGEPFVGAAGQLLNKILAAINFDRKDVYIANILKHRPPNNRNPEPEEVNRSLPFLKKQIELIDPKIILCLGKVSGQTMLNSSNTLGNMRGKFHKFGDRELYVTYHPAALLRNQQWKRPTWEDVQEVRKRYDKLNGKP
ncbi:uracil-DNA glycosylase [Rhodohalobacter halophilus]|uniref:uracil-DNA glycosylase n=1 Tax=Rhodohalobacter halophilus TaxID=1812810 RepID=UPI00083FA04A|nr:uracil-DNA glycosylase [Rhodohalobacter halophilus]